MKIEKYVKKCFIIFAILITGVALGYAWRMAQGF